MKTKLKKYGNKIINIIKQNYPICIILLIALILHIVAFIELGYNYNLNSDDVSYIRSGITFFETGKITMHGFISAQIMPGMTFLIALFCLLFGTGSLLIYALKIFWIIMGLMTIIVVYRTLRLYTNKYISAIPCILFLVPDYIWMNNIILTETPFILLFALLIYHTLKISIKENKKDYILIVIYYITAVFIRPNIGIFPLFLFIFLLLKKYNFKLLIKQCIIAGIILIVTLIPWTYRNYKVFDRFIPLTYGMGNPLLLGTYQGVGYPLDEELDYQKNVDEKMTDEMKYYLENTNEKDYLSRYYLLEYDGMKAEYRMDEWWKKDKISMLKSYLIYKPYALVYNCFYWDTIFGIERNVLLLIRRIDIILFIVSSLVILINKEKFKDWLFLMLVYGSQVLLYAYTYAFGRYAISMFFIRYIIIGIGIGIIYNKLKTKMKKRKVVKL